MVGFSFSPHIRPWTSLYAFPHCTPKALQLPQMLICMETSPIKQQDAFELSISRIGGGNSGGLTKPVLGSDISSRSSFRHSHGFFGDASCYANTIRVEQKAVKYRKETASEKKNEKSNRQEIKGKSEGNFGRPEGNRLKQESFVRGKGRSEAHEGQGERGKQDYGFKGKGKFEASQGQGKRRDGNNDERRRPVESDGVGGYNRRSNSTNATRDFDFNGSKLKSASSTRVGDNEGNDNENEAINSTSTSRRRVKEPRIRPQVHFSLPMSKDPHVAILGGGMSGLMCAVTLEERGIRSTIFDTGKHGLGGRLATRHISMNDDRPLVFDHAAQFFTVSDPQFQKVVDRWISEGAVKEWHGVIGSLRSGNFVNHAQGVKYIATDGMRSLADHIVSQGELITVKRPCWISFMDARSGRWHLMENEQSQGYYDAVVIAHNGKCANRLLAPSGVPLVAKQMKRLELSAIWALLAAFEEPLPLPRHMEGVSHFDGAFVEGVDSLSWMANNTTKLSIPCKEGPHCWTFFSTAAYGQKNKVPQESIPNARVSRVTREMLHGVELALGLSEGTLPAPLYSRVQLWGAALPKNTPNVPCIFDPYGRVGICGDWLLGSSIEAAALSGISLAKHIFDFWNAKEDPLEEFSIGLENDLTSVIAHDIGQFPGSAEVCSSQVPVPLEV